MSGVTDVNAHWITEALHFEFSWMRRRTTNPKLEWWNETKMFKWKKQNKTDGRLPCICLRVGIPVESGSPVRLWDIKYTVEHSRKRTALLYYCYNTAAFTNPCLNSSAHTNSVFTLSLKRSAPVADTFLLPEGVRFDCIFFGVWRSFICHTVFIGNTNTTAW